MEGTIGEIRAFAGNFAPKSWQLCNGQLLPINSNEALYSIIGTTYGGDGKTTFGLPDLRGRVPISSGTGPGLSNHILGERGGAETNTLIVNNLPAHTHSAVGSLRASGEKGTTSDPGNGYPAKANANVDRSTNVDVLAYSSSSNESMGANGVNITIQPTGGNAPVNNLQPYLAINFIICVYGVYPSRP